VPRCEELLDHLGVSLGALGLAVGALVPLDPEPGQTVEDGVLGLTRRALEIRVFDAKDEFATELSGQGPVEESRAGPADMEEPRGARSESSANGCHGARSISQVRALI
jgi:hypothetical protein